MRYVVLLLLAAVSAPLAAQSVVTSAGPSAVSVTMYGNTERNVDAGSRLDLNELSGFALITETREVELPPGPVTIRFEGVASGIVPVSALVFGVTVTEKNRDQRLLSKTGLLDAFTGQAVVVRRMNPVTGKVSEESGTIRSMPDRLILQTKAGFEAIECTGLEQALLFPHAPTDLTAKPTLSVTTQDQAGGKQRITLSYLASHFDWQANYVAELSADMRHVDLLAWLTLASSDQTSFVDANVFAIAGKLARVEHTDEKDLNEEQTDSAEYQSKYIDHQCWPYGRARGRSQIPPPFIPPPEVVAPMSVALAAMAAPAAEALGDARVIVRKRAEREDLGDLKLYRVPFTVTVAAHSQKQVAFLSKQHVNGEMIYRSRFNGNDRNNLVDKLYRIRNTQKACLGESLPQGKVAMFRTVSGQRVLIGETQLADKTVGEDIDLVLPRASNVSISTVDDAKGGNNWKSYALTVANANRFPVTYEAEFQSNVEDMHYENFSAKLFERKGRQVWRVVVPAESKRELSYREVDTLRRSR